MLRPIMTSSRSDGGTVAEDIEVPAVETYRDKPEEVTVLFQDRRIEAVDLKVMELFG